MPRMLLRGTFDHPRKCRAAPHNVPTSGTLREKHDSCGTPHERSEEHTSELQSLRHLVCRLLLEKKKPMRIFTTHKPTSGPLPRYAVESLHFVLPSKSMT